MGFQTFSPIRKRGAKVEINFPVVTMRANGGVHLNTRAFVEMGNPKFVTFLLDPESGDFAIQVKDEKVSGEYVLSVRPAPIGDGYDVSAQTFMQETGIADGNHVITWNPEYDAENRWYACSGRIANIGNCVKIRKSGTRERNTDSEQRANGRQRANEVVGAKVK